jgi:hypothetical protein
MYGEQWIVVLSLTGGIIFGLAAALAPSRRMPKLPEVLRQTFARVFVWSGAVRDNGLVRRNLEKIFVKIIQGKTNSLRQLHVRLRPCLCR